MTETPKSLGNNPKDRIGQKKLDLSLVPEASIIYQALAMMDGARKYEKFNWRSNAVIASIYVAACKRHLAAWFDSSEELADDSKVPHLGHALACIGILVDALENGNLIDDRPKPGPAARLLKKYQETIAAAAPVTVSTSGEWSTPTPTPIIFGVPLGDPGLDRSNASEEKEIGPDAVRLDVKLPTGPFALIGNAPRTHLEGLPPVDVEKNDDDTMALIRASRSHTRVDEKREPWSIIAARIAETTPAPVHYPFNVTGCPQGCPGYSVDGTLEGCRKYHDALASKAFNDVLAAVLSGKFEGRSRRDDL